MNPQTINRRQFLGSAAVSSLAFPHIVKGAVDSTPLRTAVIGCGWFGGVVLNNAWKAGPVTCVAICDADQAHLDKFAQKVKEQEGKTPTSYTDYQKLLDQEELDFIIIATPPQWHALPFIAACKKGVDVYIEKPLAYDIRESQAMVEHARKSGITVQVGFQRRNVPSVLEARQYIADGMAGDIRQVDTQIHYDAKAETPEIQAPPSTLDWDLWCGPAPKLPFSPQIAHIKWRLEQAYGNGHLVDWGIHWIDSVRMTLGKSIPLSTQASGDFVYFEDKITTPDTMAATFNFDSCRVNWNHRLWGAAEVEDGLSNAAIYYGDKETVIVTNRNWITKPRGRNQEKTVHEPKASTSSGVLHMQNFFQARKGLADPICSIEDGYQSTAAVQLAMIAYETNAPVRWNAPKATISENPQAAALLKRDYRGPWVHPFG